MQQSCQILGFISVCQAHTAEFLFLTSLSNADDINVFED